MSKEKLTEMAARLDKEELRDVNGGIRDTTYQIIGWLVDIAKKDGYTLEEFLDAYNYRGTESEPVIRELW